jgi:CheY-like chemotaxis protein
MLRALVVDDEASVTASLECFLRIEGYAVRTASDGSSALAAVWAERPDFIVLDLRMPDMDGLEVLRRIRQSDPSIIVILFSAYLDRSVTQQALALGVRACLQKPLNLPDLRACLTQALTGPVSPPPSSAQPVPEPR